ncbi:MAG: efflux RND transporter periplasmic adaptor subunit [Bacteroidales bacterium]
MKSTNRYTILGSCILLFAATFSFTSCSKKKEATAQAMPALPTSVAYPEVQTITVTKEYPGYLNAKQTVNLTARVSGALQQILFTPGQYVEKGTTLFVIEPTVYKNQLEEAKSALSNAQAAYNYAKASYDRMSTAALSNAVSQISVIQAKSQMDQALASINNAQAALGIAQTNLNYCYVKAPCSGRITKNTIDLGNYVNAAQAPTLATIYQDKQLYANFDITDNQYLASLASNNKSGAALMDSLKIYPGQTGKQFVLGKLDYFNPSVDLSTGTIALRAILDNHEGVLRDGQYVRVILPYEKLDDAVLIKDMSIGTDQRGRYVYLVNDSNKVIYQPVVIGELVNDSLRQIVSGIKAQDKYVTKGLMKVQPGMAVKPIVVK